MNPEKPRRSTIRRERTNSEKPPRRRRNSIIAATWVTLAALVVFNVSPGDSLGEGIQFFLLLVSFPLAIWAVYLWFVMIENAVRTRQTGWAIGIFMVPVFAFYYWMRCYRDADEVKARARARRRRSRSKVRALEEEVRRLRAEVEEKDPE